MQISTILSDEAILQALGERLAGARLARNLTQAALAEQAGVAKRTVERLEAGQSATQLSGFIRICRALGLLEQLDTLVPESTLSPIAQLQRHARKRQRATGHQAAEASTKQWTWGEGS